MEATSSSLPYNPAQTFHYWPSAAYSTLFHDQIIYYKACGYTIAHMHSN